MCVSKNLIIQKSLTALYTNMLIIKPHLLKAAIPKDTKPLVMACLMSPKVQTQRTLAPIIAGESDENTRASNDYPIAHSWESRVHIGDRDHFVKGILL